MRRLILFLGLLTLSACSGDSTLFAPEDRSEMGSVRCTDVFQCESSDRRYDYPDRDGWRIYGCCYSYDNAFGGGLYGAGDYYDNSGYAFFRDISAPIDYHLTGPDDDEEFLCRTGPRGDDGCSHQYQQEWNSETWTKVTKAITDLRNHPNHLCRETAPVLQTYLATNRIAFWSPRVLRFGTDEDIEVLYGRVSRQTGDILLWNGTDIRSHDNYNLRRTMAHEAFHILFPNYRESMVKAMGNNCA